MLPRYWTWNLWKLGMTNHLITIFKSGYEPISVATWRGFKAREKGNPKDPNVWKVERGKPIILLKGASSDLRERRLKMGTG